MCVKALGNSRPLPINNSYFYLFSKSVDWFTVTRHGWHMKVDEKVEVRNEQR